MIKVKFGLSDDHKTLLLKMTGHAGSAEPGRDLVCAAASAYAYQLAQWIEITYKKGMLRRKPTTALGAGDATVTAKPLKDHFYNVLQAFLYAESGFMLLSKNFPQYVEVETFDVSDLEVGLK